MDDPFAVTMQPTSDHDVSHMKRLSCSDLPTAALHRALIALRDQHPIHSAHCGHCRHDRQFLIESSRLSSRLIMAGGLRPSRVRHGSDRSSFEFRDRIRIEPMRAVSRRLYLLHTVSIYSWHLTADCLVLIMHTNVNKSARFAREP